MVATAADGTAVLRAAVRVFGAESSATVLIDLGGGGVNFTVELCAAVAGAATGCGCGGLSLVAFDMDQDDKQQLFGALSCARHRDNLLLFASRASGVRATMRDLGGVLGERLRGTVFVCSCRLADRPAADLQAVAEALPYVKRHGLLMAVTYASVNGAADSLASLMHSMDQMGLRLEAVYGHIRDDTVLLHLSPHDDAQPAYTALCMPWQSNQYVESMLLHEYCRPPLSRAETVRMECRLTAVPEAQAMTLDDQPIVLHDEPMSELQQNLNALLGLERHERVDTELSVLSLLDSSGIADLLTAINQQFNAQLSQMDMMVHYSTYDLLLVCLSELADAREPLVDCAHIDADTESPEPMPIPIALPATLGQDGDILIEPTASQKRMFLMHQLNADNQKNYHLNVVAVLHVYGMLNGANLQDTANELLVNQRGLTTHFELAETAVSAVAVGSGTTANMNLCPNCCPAAELTDNLQTELYRQFDITVSPPLCFRLLTFGDHHYAVSLNIHHILCDGFGLSLIVGALALAISEKSVLHTGKAAPRFLFQDFMLNEQHLQADANVAHWKTHLAQAEDLTLVADKSSVGEYRRGTTFFSPAGSEMHKAMQQLCAQFATTTFMNVLGALAVTLQAFSGQQQLVVGYPVDGRRSADERSLVACLINTAVARLQLSAVSTLAELLCHVRAVILRDLPFRHVPFEQVVRALALTGGAGKSPLFQVLLNLFPHVPSSESSRSPGSLFATQLCSAGVLDLDQSLTLRLEQPSAHSLWDFNARLYLPKTITRMILVLTGALRALGMAWSHLHQLQLGARLEPPQTVPFSFDPKLVVASERLCQFTGLSPFQVVFMQNWHTPFKTQLIREKSSRSISTMIELAEKRCVDIESSYLAVCGAIAGADAYICTSAPRLFDFFSTIIGIVSARFAYSPIDPNYPEERKRYIASSCRVVLAECQADKTPSHLQRRRFALQRTSGVDVAYAIFTSGSTGRPKGVCVPHLALGNTCHSVTTRIVSVYHECVLYQCVSLVFDVSLIDIGLALSHGAALSLALNPLVAEQEMAARHASTANFSAAVFSRMGGGAAQLWQRVAECATASGETALASAAAAAIGAGLKLLNMFGPTETTIFSTGRVVGALDDVANIGTALGGETALSLDNALHSPPVNAEGELYIGGATMARGYLNVAPKTQVVFKIFEKTGARMYATEDVVRLTPDGHFKYVGRRDFQIKMFGYRVELSEIESAVLTVSGVQQCTVLKVDTSLVAFVQSQKGQQQLTTDIAAAAKTQLASFMQPTDIVILKSFPLGFTGKIDRTKLVEAYRNPPEQADVPAVADRSAVERQAIERREPIREDSIHAIEERLAKIWSHLLKTDSIGVSDNFFDMGGSSVLILQVVARCQKDFELKMSANDVFTNPNVRQLAKYIYEKKFGKVEAPKKSQAELVVAMPERKMPTVAAKESIAVVAISGQFSGCDSAQEYWSALFEGRDCIWRGKDDPERNYIAAIGRMSNVEHFDHAFWNMSLRDAALMDPQARKLFEHCFHAMERGALVCPVHEQATGVFAGCGPNTYARRFLDEQASTSEAWLAQELNSLHTAPTRVSYMLNLTGPSFGVDTACSTSLVALAVACEALDRGACGAALVGAVSFQMPDVHGYVYEQGMIFSKDGRCRPFDKHASGTVLGAGCAAVLLVRTELDERNQPGILGVVGGHALNNDGNAKVGYTAPSVAGQTRCLAAAHASAAVAPDQIGYVECHGTGTPLGDPIEVTALHNAFRDGGATGTCVLGAVKANIGHADTAAGMAGVFKALGIFHNAEIPPQIHFGELNPQFEDNFHHFRVGTVRTSWVDDLKTKPFIGISSFGIGGTNAHVVLKHWPHTRTKLQKRVAFQSDDLIPLLMSAKSTVSCSTYQTKLIGFCQSYRSVSLIDVAAWLAAKQHMRHRAALQVRHVAEFVDSHTRLPREATLAGEESSDAIFLFPGQGAVALNAGRGAYERLPVFRQQLDSCLQMVAACSGVHVQRAMFTATETARQTALLVQTEWAQVAHLALVCAVVQQMSLWGIEPSAAVGHSLGEVCCFVLQGGVDSFADAVELTYNRSRLMQQSPKGEMLATSLADYDNLTPIRRKNTHYAAISGDYVTISGRRTSIDAIVRKLTLTRKPSFHVPTSHAFHSDLIESSLQPLQEALYCKRLGVPRLPIVSNVNGTNFGRSRDLYTESRYWCDQARYAVQLSKCIGTMASELDKAVFIEVGPGRSLTSATRQCCPQAPTVSTLVGQSKEAPADPSEEPLSQSICDIWSTGFRLDLKRIMPTYRATDDLQPLHFPPYQFERVVCWKEATVRQLTQTPQRDAAQPAVYYYRQMWDSVAQLTHLGQDELIFGLAFADNGSKVDHILKQFPQLCVNVFVQPNFARENDFVVSVNKHRNHTLIKMDPFSIGSYKSLAAWIEKNGVTLEIIVHGWLLTTGMLQRRGRSVAERVGIAQYFGLHSLYAMQQELLASLSSTVRLTVLTDGICPLAGRTQPAKHTVLGVVRTMCLEMPWIDAICVDVGGRRCWRDRESRRWLWQLLNRTADCFAAQTFAVHNGQLWTSRLSRVDSDQWLDGRACETAETDDERAVCLTGGLGHVALCLAQQLADDDASTSVLLVSRSVLEQESPQRRTMDAVWRLATTADWLQLINCDVTLQTDVDKLVAYCKLVSAKLDLLVHTAAVLPTLKYPKTAGDMEQVLLPKLHGAEHLISAIETQGLIVSVFAMTSSVNAVKPIKGQADYSAANAAQDAFVHSRRHKFIKRVLTVNMGAWQYGLRSKWLAQLKPEESLKHAASTGELTDAEGKAAFMKALLSTSTKQLIVSKEPLEAAPTSAPVAEAAATAPSDGEQSKRNVVRQLFADVLGVEQFSDDASLLELGGNSMTGIMLLNKLQRKFDCKLDLNDLMRLNSVSKMCDYLTVSKDYDAQRASGRTVLPLSDVDERKPVAVFFHPIGGCLFQARFLARLLTDAYCYYGVQFAHTFDERPPDDIHCLQTLADRYLRAIREHFGARRRFVLIGHSLGGTLAYEVARQLAAAGGECALVVQFDTWAYYVDYRHDEAVFKRMQSENAMARLGKDYARLDAAAVAKIVGAIVNTAALLMRLLLVYRPPPTDVPVHLFKSIELDELHANERPTNADYDSNYWRPIASNLSVYPAEGDHQTILDDEYLGDLADTVNTLLDNLPP